MKGGKTRYMSYTNTWENDLIHEFLSSAVAMPFNQDIREINNLMNTGSIQIIALLTMEEILFIITLERAVEQSLLTI